MWWLDVVVDPPGLLHLLSFRCALHKWEIFFVVNDKLLSNCTGLLFLTFKFKISSVRYTNLDEYTCTCNVINGCKLEESHLRHRFCRWWAPSKFNPVTSPMLFFEKGTPIMPPIAPDVGLDKVLRQMVRYAYDFHCLPVLYLKLNGSHWKWKNDIAKVPNSLRILSDRCGAPDHFSSLGFKSYESV